MNPAQVIGFLCCLGVLLGLVLAFEVGVFRLACGLCRVPLPSAGRTVGLVLLLLAVPAVVDGAFGSVLYEVYVRTNYPLWEAGVVQFFLALPAHMAICSFLHCKVMQLPLGRGLAVWLVEKLLKLGLLVLVGGVVGFVVLVAQAGK